jgi:hypothetical protein
MLTLSIKAWIGNAAAVLSGTWGAVSRRARQSGYSRTTLYHHAQRVVQAVFNEQAGGISYGPTERKLRWYLIREVNGLKTPI